MRVSFLLNGVILLILILKMVKFDSNGKSIISIEYYDLDLTFLFSGLNQFFLTFTCQRDIVILNILLRKNWLQIGY